MIYSIEEWTNIIENKFSDIPLDKMVDKLSLIYGIDNKNELDIIKETSLIIYAKKHNLFNIEFDNDLSSKDKLELIIKVLNQGWISNYYQNIYYPAFNKNKDDSLSYCCTITGFNRPNLLLNPCLETEEKAYFIGNYFIDLYCDYSKINKIFILNDYINKIFILNDY